MEHDIEEEAEETSELSRSTSSDWDKEDSYGELSDLENPMLLNAYMKQYFSVEVPQDSEVFSKLTQYQVFQVDEEHPYFFGLLNDKGEKFFGKYDVKQLYETEKRSHEVLDPQNCPSIIKMVDAIPIGEGGIIITPMYMRYNRDTLRGFMKQVMKQLLEAIKVCHDNGIAHRDIKPQNIVWQFTDPFVCKTVDVFLTDFALACFDFTEYRNKTIERIPGTLRYFAPEKLRGEIPPDPRVCDIFAAGVVFLEFMIFGEKHAFKDGTLDDIYQVLNNFDRDIGYLLLPSTCDLLKKMLELDYRKRTTVSEALEHEFITNPEPYYSRVQYAIAHNLRLNSSIFEPNFII